MSYQSVNPFNGELLRNFDQHTDQQMEQMLASADQAFAASGPERRFEAVPK
jgi:succinate-semialdehyde dehydrogenase / glutarate-semialdehyde dehydrogenase